jgi:D-glycero-alpha-D-manno-heptose-7-phosphate kinase
MIITRTPLRISFFGGGSDYPVWFRENGGSVLASTIDKSCYITTRWLPPFFEYRSRVSYSQVENVACNAAIEHPSVRGCLSFLKIEDGVEVQHIADLPARAGLGTSSSFTVGMLHGLYALRGQLRDKKSLARDAIFVEQEILHEAVGAQDQISAAYGGLNRIDFETDGNFEVRRIPISQSRLQLLEQNLALYFTGFSRTASEIAKEQVRMTPHRATELRTMQAMVVEAERILLDANRPLEEFGRLLHESWKLKRSLTHTITTPTIDDIYAAGLRAGAVGGKLLGAGGGGFMLFFVPPEHRARLRSQLKDLLCIPFKFSCRGSEVVVYEPEEVYDPSLADKRSQIYAQYA